MGLRRTPKTNRAVTTLVRLLVGVWIAWFGYNLSLRVLGGLLVLSLSCTKVRRLDLAVLYSIGRQHVPKHCRVAMAASLLSQISKTPMSGVSVACDEFLNYGDLGNKRMANTEAVVHVYTMLLTPRLSANRNICFNTVPRHAARYMQASELLDEKPQNCNRYIQG